MKLIAFSLLFLVVMGCSRTPRPDDVIAKVNDHPITVSDFIRVYDTLKPKELALAGRERAEMKNLVLKTLIRRAVILTEAERRKIHLSEDELEKGLQRMKEGYSPSSFQQNLYEHMVDESEWKEQVRQTLLIEKIFAATMPNKDKPTLKEAMAFYEKNPHLFIRPASVRALHIVVNDRKLGDEIAKSLRQSPGRFLELARKHSTGPEAKEDAKIEVEKDVLEESLDRALFETPIGKITPLISSSYGYHIFKILSRHPSLNVDFEQGKAQILKRLEEEDHAAWILKFEEHLIEKARIEYDRQLIGGL